MILDFWATWCAPCKALAPILSEIEAEYASKGVRVVGVNQRESADRVRKFAQRNGYKTMILLDRDGSVGSAYAATSLPTLVIIDREGNVRQTIRGYRSDVKQLIEAEIEPLL